MTRVIGHRGAPLVARENTVEAFLEARRLGADMVELDAHMTVDGAVVVHHDPGIPGLGVVGELRLAELPPWVPTLADALDACSGMAINIEIKALPIDPDAHLGPALAQAVADTAAERDDEILVSCFKVGFLDAVRSAHPSVPTALLTAAAWDQHRSIELCVERGHTALHPQDPAVDEALVAAAHAAGLEVNVWTVNDPDRMRQLAHWGVDGICTDDVETAVRLLRG